MRIVRGKRGVSNWLPWILLISLGVGLSFVMVGWLKNYSTEQSKTLARTVEDTIECDGLSFHIDEVQQFMDDPTVTISVINSGTLKIDQFIFHLYGPGNSVKEFEINKTITPNNDGTLQLLNPGFVVTSLEAIPAKFSYEDGEGWIRTICPVRMIEVEDIVLYSAHMSGSSDFSPPMECNTYEGSCTRGSCVLALSHTGDAHGEDCSQGNYDKKVCCWLNEDGELTDGDNCANEEDVILSLSAITDGHADNRSSDDGGYPWDICINDTNPDRKVDCYTTSSSGCGLDACVVQLSDETDAHLAACSIAGYSLKICCGIDDE